MNKSVLVNLTSTKYKELYEKMKKEYLELELKYKKIILINESNEKCRKKYSQTSKGKEAQKRASKKYYEKHIKTGRPRGRPKKNA